MSQKTKQRQRDRRKKRMRKNKRRRKRDVIMGLPLLIAFQGDPARHFRCGQSPKLRDYYELIPSSEKRIKLNPRNKKLHLLNYYKAHQVQDFGIAGKTMGIVYIKDAA